MKKSLIAMAIAGAIAAPLTANAAEAKFFGFSQITAALGKGSPNNDADGLRFGLDRIRLGYKIKQNNTWGKLQVDFMKSDNGTSIGIDEIIKDAVVGYKFSDAANVSAGVFKTPVGMDFNVSGKKLDITKRAMEKKLVLERAAGLMLSGRKMEGFGYDIGVFNPTARSSAVKGGNVGDDTAFAGRVMYDMGKTLHLEASYGSSDNAAGLAMGASGTEAYTVWDVAGSYKMDAMTFKAEYIDGSNVKGVKDNNESVWYVHGGYAFNDTFEGVVRYYSATQERASGASDSTMGNTYIGANIYLADKKPNARIQLNYVLASGDTDGADAYTGVATGYTDDIFLAQFQVGF